MRRDSREARNSRAAILGSPEDFFADNVSFDEYICSPYNRNPFTDEAALTIRRRKRSRVTHFLKRNIQRVFHMGFERKTTQIIYPVIRNAADIPNYEAIVPARHVTTSMAALSQSIHLNNNFRGGIINRQRDVVYLLSSVSARSSVESLFEDDQASLEGTGATTADSNIHVF